MSNFVSAEPSRTVLSIDRSEPRFESQTGDKIRKNFKNDGNFDVFCYVLTKWDSKWFRQDQEDERRNI